LLSSHCTVKINLTAQYMFTKITYNIHMYHKLPLSCNKLPSNIAILKYKLFFISPTMHMSTYFTILTCSTRVIVIVPRQVGRIVIWFQAIIVVVFYTKDMRYISEKTRTTNAYLSMK
jgi:hypothetical protein